MLDTDYIRTRRIKLGLTQEEAAKEAGMGTRHRWNRLERGHRPNARPETLMRVAKVLRCPVGRLLGIGKPRGGNKRPVINVNGAPSSHGAGRS